MLLEHERYCEEIVAQAEQLSRLLRGTDLTTAVPTCPEWTLADLLDHVVGNLREMVSAVKRSRRGRAPSTSALEPTRATTSGGAVGTTPAGTLDLLSAEAARLAEALRVAGRGRSARVWGIDSTTGEWARRAANDLLIHRADAALALGEPVRISADHAIDALDELLELFAGPPLPARSGRRIVLRATDNDPFWIVTPEGGGFSWRRGHAQVTPAPAGDARAVLPAAARSTESGTTTVSGPATRGGTDAPDVAELRGPLTALLLVTYRRLAVGAEGTEVAGDPELLDPWLASLALG